MYLLFYWKWLRHLTSMLVFGSVWNDLLVLHNYGAIISECQKVTFLGGQGKNFFVKMWKNQSCLKLPDLSRKFLTIFFFLQVFVQSSPKEQRELLDHNFEYPSHHNAYVNRLNKMLKKKLCVWWLCYLAYFSLSWSITELYSRLTIASYSVGKRQ